jgi:plastocyanin
MTHTFIIALLTIATAACVAGPESQPREPIGDNTVTLSDSRFNPGHITVEPGTEVTWIWDDGSRSHNVVGEDFATDIQTEGTFTHAFTEPGTYEYVCTLHQGMEGTVTVTESTS